MDVSVRCFAAEDILTRCLWPANSTGSSFGILVSFARFIECMDSCRSKKSGLFWKQKSSDRKRNKSLSTCRSRSTARSSCPVIHSLLFYWGPNCDRASIPCPSSPKIVLPSVFLFPFSLFIFLGGSTLSLWITRAWCLPPFWWIEDLLTSWITSTIENVWKRSERV